MIDGFGWVWGIPSKLVLWNAKVENHDISGETAQVLAEYLAANHLDEIKVRANQYRPLDDWKRLTRNKSVAWPWRYSLGTLSVLGETVFPGRLFGGDHYNPFTGTIHLYSDLPSVALHEAAHAKDFSRQKHPGTYAAVYGLPFVPLWHERVATNDVLAYADARGELGLRQEAYHVLFPAYGTYVGSSIGNFSGPAALPLTVGGALVGHVVGRERAARLGDEISCADTSVEAQP